jgi:hypothetical protein
MPSHLISPPAVQRVAPVSRPLGHALTHVSVAAVHGNTTKAVVQASKPALAAAQAPVSAPEHLVSQARTH